MRSFLIGVAAGVVASAIVIRALRVRTELRREAVPAGEVSPFMRLAVDVIDRAELRLNAALAAARQTAADRERELIAQFESSRSGGGTMR